MRITITAGAYGYKPNANAAPTLAMRGTVVDVPAEEAMRLVELGVAKVCEEDESAEVTAVDETSEPEAEATIMLSDMSKAQLTAMAKNMGIDCTKLNTKAKLIAAINGSDDEPPALDVEVPVV